MAGQSSDGEGRGGVELGQGRAARVLSSRVESSRIGLGQRIVFGTKP